MATIKVLLIMFSLYLMNALNNAQTILGTAPY